MDSADYIYDVFVSASQEDGEWVAEWLAPRLVAAGLRVATDEVFELAVARLINIERAIERSRYTLLVLTPTWLVSDWEHFSALLARSRDPVGRRRSTIPLVLQDCTPPRSIARLIYADFRLEAEREPQLARLLAALRGQRRRTAFGPPLGALLGLEAPTNFLFPHNPHFIGREAELSNLHQLLDGAASDASLSIFGARASQSIVCLTGLGGVGKTQLVVEYIHRYEKAYPGGIFWINAAEPLAQGFAAVGRTIGGDGGETPIAQSIQIAADYLRSDPDTLLVLDNLPDPSLLNLPVNGIVVPKSLPCRILCTTRRRDLAGYWSLTVDGLSPDQSLELLLRQPARRAAATVLPEQHAARQICHALGYLPLAIELATAFLEQAGDDVTLAGYLSRLEHYGVLATVDDQEDLDSVRRSPTLHDPVSVTLASQWDAVQDADARLALRVAALLPEAGVIPAARLGLLAGLSDTAEPGFRARLTKALGRLHKYSLLEELNTGQVRLHPLVREFAAQQTPAADGPSFVMACATNMASVYEDMAVLEENSLRRGVDAIQQDLIVTLALLATPPPQAGVSNTTEQRLHALLRIMQRESDNLRDWNRERWPAMLAQQVYNRAIDLGLTGLVVQAADRLTRLAAPYLALRWRAGRESAALERSLTGHMCPINALALFPDGLRALSGGRDGIIKIWDLRTGQATHTIAAHAREVLSVAVASDGRHAISAARDGILKVWDLLTAQVLHTLAGHTDSVTAVTITPNGRHAISGSTDRTLKVWDLQSGQIVHTLSGHQWAVNAVTVTPTGMQVISGSNDRTVKVWDLQSGEEIRTLAEDRLWVRAVAVTPDGDQIIAATDDGSITIHNLRNGTMRTLKGHEDAVTAVAVTPDGRQLVSASNDYTVNLWDLETGQVVERFRGHADAVTAVSVTRDGYRVVSASRDHTLKVWNLQDRPTAQQAHGHAASVSAVAMLPAGQRAISASTDGTLHIWNLDTGQLVRRLTGGTGGIGAMAVTPDGRQAIIATAFDPTLRVWDTETGQVVQSLVGHSASVRAVAVTPDGSRAVSIAWDRVLIVWDLRAGTVICRMVGHTLPPTALTITADGQYAVSGSLDRTLIIWNLTTHQPVGTLSGHDRAVVSVTTTPDGCYVISSAEDGTLKIWHCGTRQIVTSLVEHTGNIRAIAVTPDGAYIISAAENRTISVWELRTGRAIATTILDSALTSVALAADGTTILAGDNVGHIYCLRLT